MSASLALRRETIERGPQRYAAFICFGGRVDKNHDFFNKNQKIGFFDLNPIFLQAKG